MDDNSLCYCSHKINRWNNQTIIQKILLHNIKLWTQKLLFLGYTGPCNEEHEITGASLKVGFSEVSAWELNIGA